jgi:VWFA-related protein
MGRWVRTGTLLLALLAFFSAAWGQGAPPGPIRLAPGARPEPTPTAEQQKHAIRTRVAEVSAPVVVRDPGTEEMILDLNEKDFHVFDNGREQKINHFDLGGEPLSIVLVVETSSHVEPMLPAIRKAGIVFTQTVMGKTAEAAVLGYDDKVDVLEPFTMDHDEVESAIDRLQAGYSGMRLYDAMARGIGMLEDRPAMRRRVLMVIGEAQDSGSENKLGGVLRGAQLANVTIYSVGLSTTAADLRQPAGQYQPAQIGPPGTYPVPTPNMKPPTPEMEQAVQPNMDLGALLVWLVKTGKNAVGRNSLEMASKATGGLHVNTLHDRGIQKAIDEIGGELHAEYTIGYHAPGEEPSGYHAIKVTVDRKGVDVRTRPGYYIAPPDE